ncbi:hypothetical protein [Parasphingorhabdus sp.]|uniref:hypothetical protein n=1 Tax=Parasphingorhabdus sp. TaxID=2709688 RepID=UPI002F958D6E
MKLAKKKSILHLCAMGAMVSLLAVPVSAQNAPQSPDPATLQAMERDCISIIEDRWSSYSDEYRRGQIKSEMVRSCVENRKVQHFATAQNQTHQNRARQATQAHREYEATLKSREERIRSREKEHEERMRQWRDDVAACQAGDRSRCARTVE